MCDRISTWRESWLGYVRRRAIVVTLVVLLVLIGTLQTLAATMTRQNAATITIAESGAASPFPSTIDVSGLSGTISDVNVTLSGLSHEVAPDITVLLTGPTGQSVVLMDDAGANNGRMTSDITLTFDDAAASQLPQGFEGELSSGTFKPTPTEANLEDCSDTPAPPSTPSGPYGTELAAFNGTNPNGTWSLYVFDDCTAGGGEIAGGWSLEILALGAAVFVPDDMTVENDPGQAGAVVTFTATGVDDDDTPLEPVCTPPSGSFFPIGQTTVSCMVTSTNGREATDTFTITVIDSENPVLTVPGDMRVDADGPSGATVTYSASATDNSGSVTVDCNPPSGSTFPIGQTEVTCTATDGSGNSVSDTFTITVNELPDSPIDLLAQLRADTIALVDTSSTERSMVASLDIARFALDQGNPWLARLALVQYEMLLQREISTRRISPAEGQQLRDQLQQVIESIS